MKIFILALLGVAAAGALPDTFEPANFNVTEALLANGIDISTIPGLGELTRRSSTSGCSIACSALKHIFGNDAVLFSGSTSYDSFTNAYWAAQQAIVDPFCIYKPSTALETSIAVLLSRLAQCPFAVKSGGHAAFAGASSIEGGITIAMENMDGITLTGDKKLAAIGPGNKWLKVYQTLEKDGVQVTGGRLATIGVPGLTLGGGISHFANKYGWACDNVESYEVVTAFGIVITASSTTHPDLYWALRGGGNNFGIVTSFKFRTFVQGPMWGGVVIYLETEFDQVYAAYEKIAMNAAADLKIAQFASFGVQDGMKAVGVNLAYSDPTPWPPVFSNWKAVPAAIDGTAVANLSTLVNAISESAPFGLQETYWVHTYKVDSGWMKFSIDTFFDAVDAVADAPGILPVLTFQTITVAAMQAMQRNGGNALGLDPSKGPLYICILSIMWTDAKDNARIYKFANSLFETLEEEAGRMGLKSEFLYMNYASPWQDVVASYGEGNKRRLKEIASKYDPTGVYSRLQPGYFKLEGAPYGPFQG